ncbi:MAG: hypothetical protein N3A67_00890 [Ignavibacteria bacterium]|nr:hypothetical protein [Ignavibacteria bacterium]
MKKWQPIISLIIILFIFHTRLYSSINTNSEKTTPRVYIGLGFVPNINITTGKYEPVNKNNICCNPLDFNDVDYGTSFEIYAKAFFHNIKNFPLFDSLSYNLSSNISVNNNSLIGSNIEPNRKVYYNGEIKNLVEKNKIQIEYTSIYWSFNIELGSPHHSLNYFINYFAPQYYFSIGPIFGYVVDHNYKQTLSIVEPKGYTYDNGRDFQSKTYNNFDGLNKFFVGVNLNCNINWNAYKFLQTEWSKNFSTGIGLRYVYFFTKFIESQKIYNSNIGFRINFIYALPLYDENY